MATSAVALCNEALKLLGAETLTAFEEGSDLGETCQVLYPTTVRAALAGYPWRFTLTKAQLSRQVTGPETEWTYAHSLPPAMLVLRQLFPSAQPYAPPVRQYEVFGTLVLSHQLDLWADYQVEPDAATFPPLFRDAVRAALAAALALPVMESTERADYFQRQAYGSPAEGGAGGLMGRARRADAQQQPPQVLTDFPLLTARHGGWRGTVR